MPTATPSPTPQPNPANLVYGLKISALLPTTKDPLFPFAVGDIIVKINGVIVQEYLTKELIPIGNLGHETSSLTVAAAKFPLRDSTIGNLPIEENVELEYLKGSVVRRISLPWTRKDFFEFMREQSIAQSEIDSQKKQGEEKHDHSTDKKESLKWPTNQLL